MRPRRVLVVEDDASAREALALLLRSNGLEVTTAVDGQEAFDRLNAGFRPNLIVLDLMMPRLDGVAFCEALRRDPDLAAIPVIACSAAPDVQERTAHFAIAAFRKPLVDAGALLEAVQMHC